MYKILTLNFLKKLNNFNIFLLKLSNIYFKEVTYINFERYIYMRVPIKYK